MNIDQKVHRAKTNQLLIATYINDQNDQSQTNQTDYPANHVAGSPGRKEEPISGHRFLFKANQTQPMKTRVVREEEKEKEEGEEEEEEEEEEECRW